MALPSTGPISMSQVRTELGLSGSISLGQAAVRELAGRPSGSISMSHLRGKSAYTPMTLSNTNAHAIIYGQPCGNHTSSSTVTVSGGKPPFTYAWQKIFGGGSLSGATNTSTGTMVAFVCPGQYVSGQYRCTVKDSTGATVSKDITFSIQVEGF